MQVIFISKSFSSSPWSHAGPSLTFIIISSKSSTFSSPHSLVFPHQNYRLDISNKYVLQNRFRAFLTGISFFTPTFWLYFDERIVNFFMFSFILDCAFLQFSLSSGFTTSFPRGLCSRFPSNDCRYFLRHLDLAKVQPFLRVVETNCPHHPSPNLQTNQFDFPWTFQGDSWPCLLQKL